MFVVHCSVLVCLILVIPRMNEHAKMIRKQQYRDKGDDVEATCKVAEYRTPTKTLCQTDVRNEKLP